MLKLGQGAEGFCLRVCSEYTIATRTSKSKANNSPLACNDLKCVITLNSNCARRPPQRYNFKDLSEANSPKDPAELSQTNFNLSFRFASPKVCPTTRGLGKQGDCQNRFFPPILYGLNESTLFEALTSERLVSVSIQREIALCPQQTLEKVVSMMEPKLLQLSNHPIGNYAVQKLAARSPSIKLKLGRLLMSNFIANACNEYTSRVLQACTCGDPLFLQNVVNSFQQNLEDLLPNSPAVFLFVYCLKQMQNDNTVMSCLSSVFDYIKSPASIRKRYSKRIIVALSTHPSSKVQSLILKQVVGCAMPSSKASKRMLIQALQDRYYSKAICGLVSSGHEASVRIALETLQADYCSVLNTRHGRQLLDMVNFNQDDSSTLCLRRVNKSGGVYTIF